MIIKKIKLNFFFCKKETKDGVEPSEFRGMNPARNRSSTMSLIIMVNIRYPESGLNQQPLVSKTIASTVGLSGHLFKNLTSR